MANNGPPSPHDLSYPPTPRTPRKRKLKDLPALSDLEDNDFQFQWRPTEAELTPLDLYSASPGHFLTGHLMSEAPGFAAGFTPSQLYEMNQELLNESVPTRPLVDVISPMSKLREEYEGNAVFLKQIDWLIKNGFDKVRRTRALAFAYIENLINSPDKDLDVGMSLSMLMGTKSTLDDAGIEKMVYEDFYDELVALIQAVVPNGQGKKLTVDELQESFQKAEVSNSVVIYLRFVTSAEIRLHREQYEAFILHRDGHDSIDVDTFCSNFVQAMGKEADNVELEALCRALQLNVDVAYLDGSRADEVNFIKFRYGFKPEAAPLILLYRPGHFDILIKNSKP